MIKEKQSEDIINAGVFIPMIIHRENVEARWYFSK